MAELFKFRCTQCQKMLGAPPSKVGLVVQCPKCRAELIVPPPEPDATGGPGRDLDDPPIRLEDLGLRLDFGAELPRVPPTAASPSEPSPIDFLTRVAAEAAPQVRFQPPTPDDQSAIDPGADLDDPEPDDNPAFPKVPDPLDTPLASRPRNRRRAQGRRSDLLESAPRRRDVVLPRTAAVAWSLFGLLGLASAFAAGLLVGHFLWR